MVTRGAQFRWEESSLRDPSGECGRILVMRSGFLYWVIIYPIDTIKSIIQTDEQYAQEVKGRGLSRYSSLARYIARTSRSNSL